MSASLQKKENHKTCSEDSPLPEARQVETPAGHEVEMSWTTVTAGRIGRKRHKGKVSQKRKFLSHPEVLRWTINGYFCGRQQF